MKSAIGALQAGIGAPFRDYIAKKCLNMGLIAKPEWPMSVPERGENQVGPIDILVVDHRKERFILVEAKNLHSQSVNPKDIKEGRGRFLDPKKLHDGGFIQVLKNKEISFISNKKWHLHELKIAGVENFSVESVIVVNHPMFWPLVAADPLPIHDDLEFFNRLQKGENFLTSPITVS